MTVRSRSLAPLAALLVASVTSADERIGSLAIRFEATPVAAPIFAALFADEAAFERREPAAIERLDPGPEPTWTLHGLPAGTYAVLAFIDLDGDETLARGDRGRPQEPYALSGRPGRRPTFERASFTFGGEPSLLRLGPWRVPARGEEDDLE